MYSGRKRVESDEKRRKGKFNQGQAMRKVRMEKANREAAGNPADNATSRLTMEHRASAKG